MMIVMALLLTSLPAMAEDTHNGQMKITIGSDTSEFRRGYIELSAYLIARGDYGNWTPVKQFEDIQITSRDDGSAWISASMKQLRKRIKEIGYQPVQYGVSHDDGTLNITGLEHGIYYVAMTKGNGEKIEITPMLLSTPDKNNNPNVTANAKVQYNPPEEENTPPKEPTVPPGPVPVPEKVPMIIVPTRRGERLVDIDDYKTALGLGNIQIHVGVCYE